jgi:hypothetical protein
MHRKIPIPRGWNRRAKSVILHICTSSARQSSRPLPIRLPRKSPEEEPTLSVFAHTILHSIRSCRCLVREMCPSLYQGQRSLSNKLDNRPHRLRGSAWAGQACRDRTFA